MMSTKPRNAETRKRRALIGGFDCAWSGIVATARTQRNMRFHVLAAVVVVVAGFYFGVSAAEFAALVLAISLVMAMEVLNTAIEATVDLVTDEFHPLAKLAKDAAAGAVLVASIGAAGVGVIVLADDVFALFF